MFNFFGWLRAQARDAVLGGIADAADQIGVEDAPADLERFRNRLLASIKQPAALPASEAEAEPVKARKAK